MKSVQKCPVSRPLAGFAVDVGAGADDDEPDPDEEPDPADEEPLADVPLLPPPQAPSSRHAPIAAMTAETREVDWMANMTNPFVAGKTMVGDPTMAAVENSEHRARPGRAGSRLSALYCRIT
jgi:hypothetical protein